MSKSNKAAKSIKAIVLKVVLGEKVERYVVKNMEESRKLLFALAVKRWQKETPMPKGRDAITTAFFKDGNSFCTSTCTLFSPESLDAERSAADAVVQRLTTKAKPNKNRTKATSIVSK